MKDDIKNLINEIDNRKLIDKLYLENLIDLDTYFKYSGKVERTQSIKLRQDWLDSYFVKPQKKRYNE